MIEPDHFLASIDVESLYTSIPHDLGVGAVGYFLRSRGCQYHAHSHFILNLLRFILTKNYFIFDGRVYHQLRSTAMGTSSCAPTYANLYLGWWEATIVFGDDAPGLVDRIGLWARYIGDIFVIWQGTQGELQRFIDSLNTNEIGLCFTFEIEKDRLSFLDVFISKNTVGTLDTTIYRKPTATNSLLHWKSSHPTPLKKGIPCGQCLRLRRNCSTKAKFCKQSTELQIRFRNKAYPDHILKNT